MINKNSTILLCLILTGCASLNEDECLTADWYQIGFTDGVSGAAENHIEKHRKACSKHGIRVRFEQWLAGRDEGLLRYCTEANGLRQGLAGKHYYGVCLGEDSVFFEQAYHTGKHIYHQRQKVAVLQNEIETDLNTIADLDEDWEQAYEQSADHKISPERRKTLLDKLKNIRDQQTDLHLKIRHKQEMLYHEDSILKQMEAELLHHNEL